MSPGSFANRQSQQLSRRLSITSIYCEHQTLPTPPILLHIVVLTCKVPFKATPAYRPFSTRFCFNARPSLTSITLNVCPINHKTHRKMPSIHHSLLLLLVFILTMILFGAVEGIPPPIPRYGAFVDEVRTTRSNDVLRVKVAHYNGSGQGAYNAKAQYWRYATIDLSTGRVTADSLAPAVDPMAGYTLNVMDAANATFIDPLSAVVVSLDFSDYLSRAQQAEVNSDISALPALSFVSEKLNQAFIFVPDIEMRSSSGYDIVTVLVTVDLDTTDTKFTRLQPDFLDWRIFPYTDTRLPEMTVFDQEQLVLLPDNPFGGNGPKIAFSKALEYVKFLRRTRTTFPFQMSWMPWLWIPLVIRHSTHCLKSTIVIPFRKVSKVWISKFLNGE